METAGIEPASERRTTRGTTGIFAGLFSLPGRTDDRTIGSQPHRILPSAHGRQRASGTGMVLGPAAVPRTAGEHGWLIN